MRFPRTGAAGGRRPGPQGRRGKGGWCLTPAPSRGVSQSSAAIRPPSFHVHSIFWYVNEISSYSLKRESLGDLTFAILAWIGEMLALVMRTVKC